MNRIFWIVLVVCATEAGCRTEKKSVSGVEEETSGNVIRLAEAFERPREVRLSELADRITYVPLQTDSACLLRSTSWFDYHAPYLFNGPLVFDTDGRFVCRLGRQGQGPGEEPGNYWKGIRIDSCFYTSGCKLIGYDRKGVFTGKEMNLLAVAEGLFPVETWTNRIGYIEEWEKVGKNLLVTFRDSVYLLDTGTFRVLAAFGPTPEEKNYRFANDERQIRVLTSFRDSVLYYNYSNDTVYRAAGTDLVPRWVIDMQGYKLPPMSVGKKQKLVAELGNCIRKGVDSSDPASVIKTAMDASELVRLADGKKLILAVYETKNYLFITWEEYGNVNAELRQIDAYPQLAYYDKRTGETVVVKGRGPIDDLGGCQEAFYPVFGVYENKLITYFWPYELQEAIERRQAAGQKVSPELLDLAARTNEEDNPVLMIAHLKE